MILSPSNLFRGQGNKNGRSLQMRLLDSLDAPEWDQVVALHPEANCFHTTAWAKVLHQTYKHQPFYLQFSDKGTLAAVIPLMEIRSRFTGCHGVCLPFSDICEPLIFDPDVAESVRDQLVSFAQQRGWSHLEIRGGKSFPLASAAGGRFYGHTLNLSSDSTQMFGRFAGSVRRAIRKAERSAVNAIAVTDRQAISDFYELHVLTRHRHGLPPQPVSFFSNIYEHMIKPGHGFTVLARRGSRTITAAIFFRFGKNALYKFGASDERFQEFRANNLVMWRGIQRLVDDGAKKLHFGRTDCEDNGLRRFKLSWDTEEQAIEYFRVDPSGQQLSASVRADSGFRKKIFGALPLMFNRLAGSLVYPQLD
jgi:hypothetical protein